MTLSDGFAQNPAGTLQFLAQQAGIRPEQIFPGMQSGPSQHQVEAYVQERVAVELAKAEVQRFEQSAPEHYSVVKPLMQQLLANRAATDLNDAYKKAVAQHPAVQSIESKRSASDRRQRQIRASGASLSGAPHGIAPAPVRNGKASGGQFGDVADDVRAAMNSLL